MTTKENSDFESFASKALRMRQKGSFETLLAQHLAVAIPSLPLVKIRLVAEAAYMIPEGKIELNMDILETVYLVCISFLNTHVKDDCVSVSWGFPETTENYNRFIKSWHRDIPLSYVYNTAYEGEKKRQILNRANNDAEEFFLFTCDLDLSVGSFQILKVQFIRWAIPLVMNFFEKISTIIDPDLYKEIVSVMQPKQGD